MIQNENHSMLQGVVNDNLDKFMKIAFQQDGASAHYFQD